MSLEGRTQVPCQRLYNTKFKGETKKYPRKAGAGNRSCKGKIFSQFGMPSELKQCCKSCFTKLHRATAEFATNLTQATTAHEVQNKGRPTVSYENGSTKTKKRIERKAMDLLNNTISNFKDSCNEMSGGCGEKLLDITFQAANLPRPSVETTDESKADSNIIQGLSTAYANTRSSKERVQILSSVAPHLDNKTMKENFNYMKDGQKISCTSYELTQARLHYSQHGAAATASKEQETTAMRTSPEQLAFLVEFLHSPECTERSSYKQLTAVEREDRGLVIFLVVAHNQFFT
ncbi:hypothetical protein OS493_019915 [Desmophyllum pertusum]|uniref:Uncharacterized protein n=1 Tax=Desmophyllum pertusum TaxID=174260 RepID=A0A9X0CJP1_9CNID|nr:hypothetical protein OS493_019915 [Desmophyllum pertusum]